MAVLRGPAYKKAAAVLGEPFGDKLAALVTDEGLEGASRRLGATKASVAYWLARLGTERIAITPPPGSAVALIERSGRVKFLFGEESRVGEAARKRLSGVAGE